MLEWSGLLARDIEGFDLGAYARDANLTFDVVQKAISLKRLVEQKGASLPYRESAAHRADRSDRERDGAAKSAQTARIAAAGEAARGPRADAHGFHKELVSLRRTVRATLGSSHIDYQRLRVTGPDGGGASSERGPERRSRERGRRATAPRARAPRAERRATT